MQNDQLRGRVRQTDKEGEEEEVVSEQEVKVVSGGVSHGHETINEKTRRVGGTAHSQWTHTSLWLLLAQKTDGNTHKEREKTIKMGKTKK